MAARATAANAAGAAPGPFAWPKRPANTKPLTARNALNPLLNPTDGVIGSAARGLERDVPEREPTFELGLQRQGPPHLGLQPQLTLDVPLLRARRRHERVVEPALEVVDEVDGLAVLLERE